MLLVTSACLEIGSYDMCAVHCSHNGQHCRLITSSSVLALFISDSEVVLPMSFCMLQICVDSMNQEKEAKQILRTEAHTNEVTEVCLEVISLVHDVTQNQKSKHKLVLVFLSSILILFSKVCFSLPRWSVSKNLTNSSPRT